jgi:predicted nucleic acid-binding protein
LAVTDRRVLVDTGPLVAFVSTTDAYHRRCAETLAALDPPLLTCWPVLTEAAWLLRQEPVALAKLFEGFDIGLLALLELDPAALPWIAAFLRRYVSARIQLADAALAYLAEREGVHTLFTLDRRDFSIIRLKRNRVLRLIPDAP